MSGIYGEHPHRTPLRNLYAYPKRGQVGAKYSLDVVYHPRGFRRIGIDRRTFKVATDGPTQRPWGIYLWFFHVHYWRIR